MPFFTTFDGTADTVYGPPDFSIVYYASNNFARLTGSGGLKFISGTAPGWHIRNESTSNHFVQVVLGTDLAGGLSSSSLITFRAASNGFDGHHIKYNESSATIFLQQNSSNVASFSQTLTAGDILRGEVEGEFASVYVNGVLKLTHNIGLNAARTYVGFRGRESANTGEVLRSWESGVIESDVTGPVLTTPTLVAASSTSLTGGLTTNEAGLGAVVLYPAALAAPSIAQIEAGQDVNGTPAVVVIAAQPFSVGPVVLSFPGLTPSTAYKYSAVQRDSATPTNNLSNVLTSASATTNAPSRFATVTLTTNGATPAASLTGLRWAWWDAAPPNLATAPLASGTGATTDAAGLFSATLTGLTALAAGQTGTLLVFTSNGTPGSTANMAYCAPVVVS
jgi:hypothetical protein